MTRILVVDDDAELRMTVASSLAGKSYDVKEAADGAAAVEQVKKNRCDLIIMDVHMPVMSGLEALKQIKAIDPSIIVIMLTAYSSITDAVAAVKEGAFNYVAKPIKHTEIQDMVERALEAHRLVQSMALSAPVLTSENEPTKSAAGAFIAQSTQMKSIFGLTHRLAKVDTAVLIRGESGTGKEVVARAVHFNSVRKNEKFVPVNCSAIPDNLIESELFGHEKGAFTGADSRKIGRFQYAEGGTLFLDEIGDITPSMQVKLLRVLQDKRFTPIGSNREIEANVRIIAATNRNLEEMVQQRTFREDLFYRLNVLPIYLAPLRERKDDVQALVTHFISRFNRAHHRNISAISPTALEALKRYNWPGNIRELENVIEHAFVMENEDFIQLSSLPAKISGVQPSSQEFYADEVAENAHASGGLGEEEEIDELIPAVTESAGLNFQLEKEEFEKNFIIRALKVNRGRINMTARNVNIPKKTLLRKIEKYGINARDYFQTETVHPEN